MLVKWIVATVPADRRTAFVASQQVWSVLAYCEGFLGQVGGWDTDGRACILGLWRDADAYERFMARAHDPILAADSGPPAFLQLDIATAHVLVRVPGLAADLAGALPDARWLRMADGTVAPDGLASVVGHALRDRVARLTALESLSAGALAVSDSSERALEVTLWSEADAPAGALPSVRGPRSPEAALTALRAHRVALDPGWTVLPAS